MTKDAVSHESLIFSIMNELAERKACSMTNHGDTFGFH